MANAHALGNPVVQYSLLRATNKEGDGRRSVLTTHLPSPPQEIYSGNEHGHITEKKNPQEGHAQMRLILHHIYTYIHLCIYTYIHIYVYVQQE